MGGIASALKPVPKQKKKTDLVSLETKKVKRWKRGMLTAVGIYAVIVLAYVFIISSIFVWTRPLVPTGAVPYYVDVLPKYSELWGAEHLVNQIDIMMYLIPLVTALCALANPLGNFTFYINIIVVLMSMLWHFAMVIFNSVRWSNCKSWAICVEEADPPTTTPNPYFFVIFACSIVFMFYNVALFILPIQLKHAYLSKPKQTGESTPIVGTTARRAVYNP